MMWMCQLCMYIIIYYTIILSEVIHIYVVLIDTSVWLGQIILNPFFLIIINWSFHGKFASLLIYSPCFAEFIILFPTTILEIARCITIKSSMHNKWLAVMTILSGPSDSLHNVISNYHFSRAKTLICCILTLNLTCTFNPKWSLAELIPWLRSMNELLVKYFVIRSNCFLAKHVHGHFWQKWLSRWVKIDNIFSL